MKFIEVRINEGGKVFMKDEKESKLHDEEKAIREEFCDAINADKKLAMFFKQKLEGILRTYAKEVIFAYSVKDKPKASAAAQQAGEDIKGLMMFMHTKVMMKKKEVT